MRSARDVVNEVRMVSWNVAKSSALIEADRAELRAEIVEKAKALIVGAIQGTHGDIAPTCCDRCAYLWQKAREDRDAAIAALDSLRDGKE